MIYRIATLLFFTVCYTTQAQITAVNTNARTIPFDVNWKFIKGEIPYAETVRYKDNNWRTLDLPHDWSIEDLPGQLKDSIVGPFHKASIGASSTGYTVGGIGWYRNTFKLNKKYKDKRISIFFDGVYMNNDVWINGHHLGNHPYGYTPFNFDLTPYLKFDVPNVIAVKVNNVGKNSRWYTGSGIYRHVWLTATETVFINSTSVYITTPEVSKVRSLRW
jgi:beta-galactosidase